MLLYAKQHSPRLSYIVDFAARELLAETVTITTDRTVFSAYGGPKINYGNDDFCPGAYRIGTADLLYEKGLRTFTISCFQLRDLTAFFETQICDHGFDIFSAMFYLLSRYEEYEVAEKDHYGRFPHTAALAYREGFLKKPLVNVWLLDLKERISKKFSGIKWQNKSFQFVPTYDIDIAWSYLHKGRVRNAGGFARSLLRLEFAEIKERWLVLRGKKKDPFDSFEWLETLHQRFRLQPIYFFIVAEKQAGYDKNIHPANPAFRELVTAHRKYVMGIHPSWQSGDDPSLLAREIVRLEELAGQNILRSRQHFLRMSMPVTYRLLVQNGIMYDYTMGYGTINGFRASVASCFYWYDLELEKQTELLIVPFCFMDATGYYVMKQSASDALREMVYLYNEIKKVNGLMITLWHNNLLGTAKAFRGWREVYEQFVETLNHGDSL